MGIEWPEPERGVLPDEPAAAAGLVEPETGIEVDDETAREREETFTPGGKEGTPAPSGG